jgi:uridine kinase
VSQTELFQRIKSEVGNSNRTLVISIDGHAGAGKTTLAQNIEEEFDGVEIIHMDDLYRGWLLTLGPTLTRELQSIIEQLNEEGVITYSKFDWYKNAIGEDVTIEVPNILVLEGVGSGQGSIAERVDIKVWIDLPAHEGMERVLARDGEINKSEMELFLLDQEAHFTAELTQERSDFQIPGK